METQRRFSRAAVLLLGAWTAVFPPTFAQATNAPVKDLGKGRFQIGLVTLDRQSKSLSFPAAVNMNTGLVEYLVVTTGGKIHESVFKTEAEPFHIHAAMLLLGAKLDTNIDTAVFFDPKREIPGPKLKIEVAIPAQGGRTLPIHEFLQNAQSKTTVTAGQIPHWIYNGSRMSDGVFLAQREGSVISLIADPSAVINNPRQDRQNDELWMTNEGKVPPVDTPVVLKFALAPE